MEVNRRISCGRLSELIGPKSLETDRIARILGFRRTAARDLRDLPRGILKSLEAYSDGVNACIDGRGGLPVEFTLLKYRPDPWIPLDNLSFIRLMTWGLSFGWTADLIASRLVEALGADLAKDLQLAYPPGHLSIVGGRVAHAAGGVDDLLTPARGGLNAWAIAPSQSETGHAVLANDPHLPMRLPSNWYENHLVGGGYEVTGASFPGLPAVAIGHNRHIAWGLAVSFAHAQSLHSVELDPAIPGRFRERSSWQQAKVETELISAKGRADPIKERVYVTPIGPVVPQIEFGGAGEDNRKGVISSSSLGPSQDLTGFLRLNTRGIGLNSAPRAPTSEERISTSFTPIPRATSDIP